ncbi:hypothetical protein N0V88_006294 [Collariella sp. IMI 366227]|nr:hypothetical protein N0V88_006294 [Collariella sp. IMI 366227]
MFENRSIAFTGLLGLLISFIVVGSFTGQRSSESELAFDSPVCLQPSIRAQVVRPSAPVPVFAKTGNSGHELPLDLSFARVGKNNVGKNLTYAVGIRPAQNDGAEPVIIAKGQVYAGQDTVREVIAIKNLTAGASYELTVEVASQTNGTLGQDLGKDIVYVTAVHGSKEREPLSLEFSEADEYWNNWLGNIYRNNLTIPTPGPRSKVSYRINVRVRWEDFSSGAAAFPGFAGATVWIYIHSMDDESRTLYGHSSMTLNSAGRASATVKIPRDQYIALITVAFDNKVMRFITLRMSWGIM